MRLKPINVEELSDEQRAVLREAEAGRRGHVPKPMLGWIASPEFARRAQHLGAFVRYETSLSPLLSELAILITARHCCSAYEWQAHKREALKAGLDPAVIDAIAARRAPPYTDDEARAVDRFATALLQTHRVPREDYDEAVSLFGERGVGELIGVIGYYVFVAMTLNTFEFDLPDGVVAEISHDD